MMVAGGKLKTSYYIFQPAHCCKHPRQTYILRMAAFNLHALTLRAKEAKQRSEVSSSALPRGFTAFCPHN